MTKRYVQLIKDCRMNFYEVLEKRRTYRDFSGREVNDGILRKVIGAAFKAPTNDHLRQLEFVVVRGHENIAKVIAPLAKNIAAFRELVAEVDESGDKDKMAMFADALPKQQKMLMESGLLIIPFFRQLTCPLLQSSSSFGRFNRLRTVFLQPFHPSLVRQMLDGEVFKSGIKAIAVRAGPHNPYHNRTVVLHPGVAHHCIFLVIKGIENFHGVQPAHSLYPYKRYGILQRYDTPVARAVGYDSAEIVLSVHELNASLYIVFVIYPQHQSRLVEPGPIVAGYFHFNLEFPSAQGIKERGVIHGKPIMRYPPVISLRSDMHRERVVFYFPLFRFVEPLHFF